MPESPAASPEKALMPVQRKRFLIAAIEAGAKYVDIEIQSDGAYRREIIKKAKLKDCKVIISFHDFIVLPNKRSLRKLPALCFSEGADIAKIACRVILKGTT